MVEQGFKPLQSSSSAHILNQTLAGCSEELFLSVIGQLGERKNDKFHIGLEMLITQSVYRKCKSKA